MTRNVYCHKVNILDDPDHPHRSILQLECMTRDRKGQFNWKNSITINAAVYDNIFRQINQRYIEQQGRKISDLEVRIQRLKESVEVEQ